MKLTSLGKYFLSPDLKTLVGERAALEELVARGSSVEDVARMLELMTTFGWNRSIHLPAGWIFTRKFNLTQVVLVSEAGQVFEGFSDGRLFIARSSKYYAVDLDMFDMFCQSNDTSRRNKRKERSVEEWVEAASLPPGWRVKTGGQVRAYLSPRGQVTSGERSTLQSIIKEGYPQADVYKFQLHMTTNGWEFSDLLPAGWMFTQSLRQSVIVIITEGGKIFYSYKAAQQHMETSSKFTKDQVEMLDQFWKVASKEARREEVGQDRAKLPEGWMRLDGRVPFFIAPDGSQSMGSLQALRHMQDLAVPRHQIQLFLQGFVDQGWERDSSLPTGWIAKVTKNGHQKKMTFITREFRVITGEVQLRRELEGEHGLAEEEVLGLMMFLEIRAAMARAELWDWKEDEETLPAGWKTRTSGKTKVLFLSPDGQQFESRVRGLQHLIKEHFGEDQVTEMTNCVIKHDKWEKNSKLPESWIFKDFLSRYPNFLTETGELLNSFEAATKCIQTKNEAPSNLLESMSIFHHDITKRRRVAKHVWETSELLPAGWRQRRKGPHLYLLSPTQVQCQGVGAALRHMVDQGSTDQQAAIMESLLKKETR